MRILFIGDVVGKTGRTAILDRLPGLITDWKLDLVIVNGENAAGGFGITETIYTISSRPVRMPSRSATTPGIRKRRWCLSSAHRA